MQTDESSLTGETLNMHKSHITLANYSTNPVPFLLESTLVTNGNGKALVCCVGESTNAGKAARSLDIENEQTPL